MFETNKNVVNTIEGQRAALGTDGSVLVRASGTEQLIRVTVEAGDDDTALSVAGVIAQAIREADGQ